MTLKVAVGVILGSVWPRGCAALGRFSPDFHRTSGEGGGGVHKGGNADDTNSQTPSLFLRVLAARIGSW